MSKQWKNWTNVMVSTLLAIALAFSQGALAEQNQSNKAAAQSVLKEAQQGSKEATPFAADPKALAEEGRRAASEETVSEEKSPGDGKREGIKVHGHWTIEVRNPDGEVVTHREFENSLVPGILLNSLFTRSLSVGIWQVVLSGDVCNLLSLGYFTFNNVPGNCNITEFDTAGSLGGQLTTSASGNSFLVNAFVTAAYTGSVTAVSTWNLPCTPNVAPSSITTYAAAQSCGLNGYPFTGTTLTTPIQVSAGQTIAVTVNISFS